MCYNTVVKKLFELLYATYHYPFERSDARIYKMKDPERKEYFRQAKELLDNRAFIQEFEELTRKYYQELAVKATNETEKAAYRLTLKAIQDFHKRFQQLGAMYTPHSPNKLPKL